MKSLLAILALSSSLVLGGCAKPLQVAQDSGRYADALRIPFGEVLFLSYGAFGRSPKGPNPTFMRNEGVVVATPGQLYITHEAAEEKTKSQPISLPYSAMQTVAHMTKGLGCEIHIESDGYVYLLIIAAHKKFWDCEGSSALFDLITAKGVRVVATQKRYYFEESGEVYPFFFIPPRF